MTKNTVIDGRIGGVPSGTGVVTELFLYNKFADGCINALSLSEVDGSVLNVQILSECANCVGGSKVEVGVEGAGDSECSDSLNIVEIVERMRSKCVDRSWIAVENLQCACIKIMGIILFHCCFVDNEHSHLYPLQLGVAAYIEVKCVAARH